MSQDPNAFRKRQAEEELGDCHPRRLARLNGDTTNLDEMSYATWANTAHDGLVDTISLVVGEDDNKKLNTNMRDGDHEAVMGSSQRITQSPSEGEKGSKLNASMAWKRLSDKLRLSRGEAMITDLRKKVSFHKGSKEGKQGESGPSDGSEKKMGDQEGNNGGERQEVALKSAHTQTEENVFTLGEANSLIRFRAAAEGHVSTSYSDLVTIVIRNKRGDFVCHIHKFILVNQSRYFQRILDKENGFKESTDNIIILEDVHVEAFEQVIEWLYSQIDKTVDPGTGTYSLHHDKHKPNMLLELYILADRFDIRWLSGCVTSAFWRLRHAQDLFNAYMVNDIVSKLPGLDLYTFAIHWWAINGNPQSVRSLSNIAGREVVEAILEVMLDHKHSVDWDTLSENEGVCYYHGHYNGEVCLYRDFYDPLFPPYEA
ncbi:Hypothetical protein D9617_8g050620 [Elsinoe fawcettii]|nr:Hypothetical protein D9617_8g050620 [Elsinoe fawcettii]